MLVVDASVVAPLVADAGQDGRNIRHRVRDEIMAAPDLLRVEVLSVVRRQLQSGSVDDRQAGAAIDDLIDLPVEVYPTAPLLRRAWELHENVTAYDACYVILAEALGCPLLTADSRLARAPGVACNVETI